jgi:hypothetical protein
MFEWIAIQRTTKKFCIFRNLAGNLDHNTHLWTRCSLSAIVVREKVRIVLYQKEYRLKSALRSEKRVEDFKLEWKRARF